MKKKWTWIVILALMLFFMIPMSSQAASKVQQGVWRLGTQGWWFQLEDGNYCANDFYEINGQVYYFDELGWMKTGWVYTQGNWYYFQPSGAMLTGWLLYGGDWYYMEKDANSGQYGVMRTEYLLEDTDGNTYYLDETGIMVTDKKVTFWQGNMADNRAFDAGGRMIKKGWFLDVSGYTTKQWMYFDENGVPANGWFTYGGKQYYLNAGYALMGAWVMECDGEQHLYTFDTDGALTGDKLVSVGWNLINDYYYYYDGTELALGWRTIDGERYRFAHHMLTSSISMEEDGTYVVIGSDGKKAVSQWVETSDGKWSYANEYGITVRDSWLQIGEEWYYIDNFWHRVTEPTVIDGQLHLFNASGIWLGTSNVESGWVAVADSWCYLENGQLATGLRQIDGKWYYFYESDGLAVVGGYAYVSFNGVYKPHYFGMDGAMATGSGWQYSHQSWYYTYADGSIATSTWEYIDGVWYYFGISGKMYSNGLWAIQGKNGTREHHFFAESGAWIGQISVGNDGWYYLYGDWYYFEDGDLTYGLVKSGTQIYYIDGKMITNTYRPVSPNLFFDIPSPDGVDIHGTVYILWFDENGCMVRNQRKYIEDLEMWVWFDAEGYGQVPYDIYIKKGILVM